MGLLGRYHGSEWKDSATAAECKQGFLEMHSDFFATLTLCVKTIFTTWKTLVDTLVEGCCLQRILVILESAVIFWYR